MSEAEELDIEAALDCCEEKDAELSAQEREFIDQCSFMLGEGLSLFGWRLERLNTIYQRVRDRA